MRPTCASSGSSSALLGLAPPGSAVSTAPAGMSSAGNHPAPQAVSFLLRCRPSRDPRLRGAGCPMEGGLSSGRDTCGFPFQTLPFWNLGPQASTSRGRPRALDPGFLCGDVFKFFVRKMHLRHLENNRKNEDYHHCHYKAMEKSYKGILGGPVLLNYRQCRIHGACSSDGHKIFS